MIIAASAATDSQTADLSAGLVSLVIGLILCFAGVWSLRLTGLLVGFTLAAALADVLGASALVTLIVGIAGAIGGLLVVTLVFRAALWILGGLAGGTIAVRVYQHVPHDQASALVVVLCVVAAGVIGGFLVDRYQRPLLAVVTAIGGAGVVLGALGEIWPTGLAFLREPTSTTQSVLSGGAWILLALAGWVVQRRRLRSKEVVGSGG